MRHPTLEEQIDARILEVRRAAEQDPLAGAVLAAYYRRRLELVPDHVRARPLAALDSQLGSASIDDREVADRYVELRNVLCAARGAAPSSPAEIDFGLAWARKTARVAWYALIAFVVACLALLSFLVVGLGIDGVGAFFLFVVRPGIFPLIALVFILRHLETQAILAVSRADEARDAWEAWRKAEDARTAIVDGADGRWLFALASAHPALAFPELAAIRPAPEGVFG